MKTLLPTLSSRLAIAAFFMIGKVVPVFGKDFGLASTKQVYSSTREKHNFVFGCFDSKGVNN
jgi:hypothetical protein